MRILSAVAIVLVLSTSGCRSAPSGDLPEGGAGADIQVADFCEATCAARDAIAVAMGFCFWSETDGFTACRDYCRPRAAAWSDEVKKRFDQCARTNPLCFQSIEQCLKGP